MNIYHSKKYPIRLSEQYNSVENFKVHERRLCNLYEIAIRTESLQSIIFEFGKILDELNQIKSPTFKSFINVNKAYMKDLAQYNLSPKDLYVNYSFLQSLSKQIPKVIQELMNRIDDGSTDKKMNEMVELGKAMLQNNVYIINHLNLAPLYDHNDYKLNEIKQYSEVGCLMFELINKSRQQRGATFNGASTTYTFPFFSRPVVLNSSDEKRTMFELNLGLTLEENKALLELLYQNKGIIPNDTGVSFIGMEMEVNEFDKEPKYFADALFVYDYYEAALVNNYHEEQERKITFERDRAINALKNNDTLTAKQKKELVSNEKRKANKRIRSIEETLIEKIRDLVLPDYTTKAIKVTYLKPMQELVRNFKIPKYKFNKKDNLPQFKKK